MTERAKRGVSIRRQRRNVVMETVPQTWSRRFIELAGSARDFPYPPDPPITEPRPLKVENWRR